MNKYLTPDHSDAFVDFPVKERHETMKGDKWHPCPKCKQHGGWNLRLNAYPLRENDEDTPEIRHKRSHFRSFCDACWGWGWSDEECAHDFHDTGTIGRCLHKWKCRKCGKTRTVDTSG